MKSLYLVMNPESGTRTGRRVLPDLVSLFTRAGYFCSVYLTEQRGSATDFVRLHSSSASTGASRSSWPFAAGTEP